MQLMSILIELRGEGAAIAGISIDILGALELDSGASSILVLHAPYKVTAARTAHSHADTHGTNLT